MVSEKLLRAGFSESLKQRRELRAIVGDLRTRFDNEPAALLTFNHKGEFLYGNKKARSLYGVIKESELPIKTISDLFEKSQESPALLLYSAAQHRVPLTSLSFLSRRTVLGKEPVKKDTALQFSVTAGSDGAPLIQAHLSDVQDLINRTGVITKLLETLPKIHAQKKATDVFQTIADEIAKNFDAVTLVWKAEGNKLHLKGACAPKFAPEDLQKTMHVDFGHGLAGLAAQTSEIQELEDIKQFASMPKAFAEIDEKYDFGNSLAIPILNKKGKLLAVIGVYKQRGQKFFDYHRALLDLITGSIGAKLTELALINRLGFYAAHDPLTHVFNQSGFYRALAKKTGLYDENAKVAALPEEIEEAAEGRMGIADLDRLKAINDSLGHQLGDKAIKLFANFLKKNLSKNAIVSRWGRGSDEFYFFDPKAKEDPEFSRKLEAKFADLLKSKYKQFYELGFGVSVGYSDFVSHPKSEQSINLKQFVKARAEEGQTVSGLRNSMIRLADEKVKQHKQDKARTPLEAIETHLKTHGALTAEDFRKILRRMD